MTVMGSDRPSSTLKANPVRSRVLSRLRLRITMESALQEGRDTACALRYRHDFYGAGGCTIDDEVSANGPEQNRKCGEILALVANARCIANGVKGVE